MLQLSILHFNSINIYLEQEAIKLDLVLILMFNNTNISVYNFVKTNRKNSKYN